MFPNSHMLPVALHNQQLLALIIFIFGFSIHYSEYCLLEDSTEGLHSTLKRNAECCILNDIELRTTIILLYIIG